MITEQIREELKEAMKSREEIRLLVLRGLLSAFTNELVAQKKKPQDELSDEDALNVIKRAVKQRKDSIQQFEKGGRYELAETEKAELKILEKYLPAMISEEEIVKIAEAKKSEMGVDDISKMGILIGAVLGQIKSTGGEADGALVKEAVENLFK